MATALFPYEKQLQLCQTWTCHFPFPDGKPKQGKKDIDWPSLRAVSCGFGDWARRRQREAEWYLCWHRHTLLKLRLANRPHRCQVHPHTPWPITTDRCWAEELENCWKKNKMATTQDYCGITLLPGFCVWNCAAHWVTKCSTDTLIKLSKMNRKNGRQEIKVNLKKI